jgi:hypothetical protein
MGTLSEDEHAGPRKVIRTGGIGIERFYAFSGPTRLDGTGFFTRGRGRHGDDIMKTLHDTRMKRLSNATKKTENREDKHDIKNKNKKNKKTKKTKRNDALSVVDVDVEVPRLYGHDTGAGDRRKKKQKRRDCIFGSYQRFRYTFRPSAPKLANDASRVETTSRTRERTETARRKQRERQRDMLLLCLPCFSLSWCDAGDLLSRVDARCCWQ